MVAHNRVTGHFASSREFEAYQRYKAAQPVALAIEEVDADTVRALRTGRMDERHTHLDALLD